jgi:DNA-binding NtrC family response regulator
VTVASAMRVLIVEDEADLAEVFHDFIVSRGHTADVVGSAEAALERLRTSPPDTIVLDVKLPGMSGLQFMSLPVVREAALPVIVVSGHATEREARECLRLGALEFLSKPVPLETLGAVLEHAELFVERDGTSLRSERRLTRRIPANLPVRIVHEHGKVTTGRVVEVSTTGLRARLDASLRPGAAVRVSITMPDTRGSLEVIALVVRADPDGAAVWFLDLPPADAERLTALGQ